MYSTERSTQCSVVTQRGGMEEGWDGGVGGREAQQGEDICMHIADSLCCTAEMNTTL